MSPLTLVERSHVFIKTPEGVERTQSLEDRPEFSGYVITVNIGVEPVNHSVLKCEEERTVRNIQKSHS